MRESSSAMSPSRKIENWSVSPKVICFSRVVFVVVVVVLQCSAGFGCDRWDMQLLVNSLVFVVDVAPMRECLIYMPNRKNLG